MLLGLFCGTFPVLNQFSVSVLETLGLFQPVFFSSSLQTVGHLVGINLEEEEEARLPVGKSLPLQNQSCQLSCSC